jgi:Ca-activated chloride channel homolog
MSAARIWLKATGAALIVGLVVAAVVVDLAAAGHPAACGSASGTLRVLTGHSLYADSALRAILDEARDAVGVQVELGDQEGTLVANEKILGGDLTKDYDAVWLPSNQYLMLDPRAAAKIDEKRTKPIALSPVVIGVRPEVAKDLGWDKRRPTWGRSPTRPTGTGSATA